VALFHSPTSPLAAIAYPEKGTDFFIKTSFTTASFSVSSDSG